MASSEGLLEIFIDRIIDLAKFLEVISQKRPSLYIWFQSQYLSYKDINYMLAHTIKEKKSELVN